MVLESLRRDVSEPLLAGLQLGLLENNVESDASAQPDGASAVRELVDLLLHRIADTQANVEVAAVFVSPLLTFVVEC